MIRHLIVCIIVGVALAAAVAERPQAPPIRFAPQAPPVIDFEFVAAVPCDVAANSPQAPVCDCGCADGKPCKCGLKCPDLARMPKQMPTGWHSDYETAFAESQSTGRPLFVDVRTASCPWCDKLDQELAQVDLSEFVLCRLDATAYQAQTLGVTAFPTTIVIRNGNFAERHVGFAPAQTIRSLLHPVRAAAQTFGRVVTMPIRVMGGACRSGH